MISNEPLPLKNLGLWSLFFLAAFLAAYIIFAAMVSVWVGLTHVQQEGFWMPLLTGILVMIVVLWKMRSAFRPTSLSHKDRNILDLSKSIKS